MVQEDLFVDVCVYVIKVTHKSVNDQYDKNVKDHENVGKKHVKFRYRYAVNC